MEMHPADEDGNTAVDTDLDGQEVRQRTQADCISFSI